MRNTSSGCSAKIEHLASRAHVDVVDTTEDTGSQLAAERVPDAVFGAAGGCVLAISGSARGADADALLAVNALAGSQVLGDKEILLSASNEDTGMAMGLDDDLAVTGC